MKIFNKYLDILAEGRQHIFVFDCEFWHVLAQEGDNVKLSGKDFFFLPRETGGFVLSKKLDGSWEYKNYFYATFSRPRRDVAMPISHFSTVAPSTAYKLDEIEKQLSVGWGEAFPSRLSPQERELWEQGVNLYESEPSIKEYHQPQSWNAKMMALFPTSMVIVKGTSDLYAMKNACQLYGMKWIEPSAINDIANWNSESRQKCGSAKLEDTFKCVKDGFDDNIGGGMRLRDILPLGKSHDPSVDASMTLLVAMYIISKGQ